MNMRMITAPIRSTSRRCRACRRCSNNDSRFGHDTTLQACYGRSVQSGGTMHRTTLALAAFVGTLFFASPAAAASFDCSRARGADEVTVCRTASLSALDSELGGLWY